MSPDEVEDFLYEECGLKGLSGISNDVRELDASSDPRAGFALDYFAYRVGLQAGLLAAALGGVDGFVFTAGIGENSPSMRARIVEKLARLGGTLDPAANERGPVDIESRGPPRYTYRVNRRGTDDRAPHLGTAFDARRPLDSLVNRWTNGFAEGSVGPRPRAINLIAVWTG